MLKSLVLTLWFLAHPVHVTLTSIDYVPENDSLNVFVKMYFDDFLLDYGISGAEYSPDSFPADTAVASDLIEDYINRNLIIEVNDNAISGKLNRLEIVDNEVKLNLNYKLEDKPEKLTVRNLIMTSLYSDQSNFLIVRVEDFEEGVRLSPDITEKSFNIKHMR